MTIRWTKLCLDLRWQVQNSLPGAEPRLRLSDKPLPGDHTSWPVQKKYVDKKNELKLLSKDKIIWKISPKDQLSERSHVFRDRCICYEFYECTLYLNYYTVLMLHPTSIYCRMSRDVRVFMPCWPSWTFKWPLLAPYDLSHPWWTLWPST